MIKRLLCALFAIVFLICSSSMVIADSTINSYPTSILSANPHYTDKYTILPSESNGNRLNYITVDTFSIASNSAGKVSFSITVSTNAIMKKLGFTTLRVQHWNGSSWEDVWTKTDQYLYDTDYFPYVKTLSNMASNDYYRISVDLYAKKGFLLVQTLTVVSDYILCQ